MQPKHLKQKAFCKGIEGKNNGKKDQETKCARQWRTGSDVCKIKISNML